MASIKPSLEAVPATVTGFRPSLHTCPSSLLQSAIVVGYRMDLAGSMGMLQAVDAAHVLAARRHTDLARIVEDLQEVVENRYAPELEVAHQDVLERMRRLVPRAHQAVVVPLLVSAAILAQIPHTGALVPALARVVVAVVVVAMVVKMSLMKLDVLVPALDFVEWTSDPAPVHIVEFHLPSWRVGGPMRLVLVVPLLELLVVLLPRQ